MRFWALWENIIRKQIRFRANNYYWIRMAEELGIDYIEASAKNFEKMQEVIINLVKEIHEKKKNTNREKS